MDNLKLMQESSKEATGTMIVMPVDTAVSAKHWETFYHYIEDALPSQERGSVYSKVNLLERVMKGNAQLWVAYMAGGPNQGIAAIYGTELLYNKFTDTSACHVFAFTALKPLFWLVLKRLIEDLRRFCKSIGVTEITTTVENEVLARIYRKYGAKDAHYLSLEV